MLRDLAAAEDRLRVKCLEEFARNWDKVVRSRYSCLLLTTCLSLTPSNSYYFRLIGQCLLDRSPLLSSEQHIKNVLLVYLEFCSAEELEVFYRILDLDSIMPAMNTDKYMVYIFRLLLRRGHKKSKQLLLETLKKHSDAVASCPELQSVIAEQIPQSGSPATHSHFQHLLLRYLSSSPQACLQPNNLQ